MQDLIDQIVEAMGLAPEQTEQALGIMLNLIRTQGNQQKVDEIFDKLPGATGLAVKWGGDGGAKGGLLGMLAGGVMGGPLAAITKLTSIGLSMDQIKQMGIMTLAFAKQQAGEELVKDVAGSIPGLSAYV
jgi:hypothetical protein